MGLVIAYLLTQIYKDVITQPTLYLTVTILLYGVMSFVGTVIGSKKGGELLSLLTMAKKNRRSGVYQTIIVMGTMLKKKNPQECPKFSTQV